MKAASLARIVERKASQSPRNFRAEVIYGFDVPTEEFERSFAQYIGGNLKKIAKVRDFVKAAILFHLGSAPDAVVNFT
jgi:hypothetical protein